MTKKARPNLGDTLRGLLPWFVLLTHRTLSHHSRAEGIGMLVFWVALIGILLYSYVR